MDEDTEVLDWGNEDDEQQGAHLYQKATAGHDATWRDPDDAEDAVSLGDEDEAQDFATHQSTDHDSSQRGKPATPRSPPEQRSAIPATTFNRTNFVHFNSAQKQPPSQPQPNSDSPNLKRTQSQPKLIHALPPKPVLTAPVYVQPLPPQTSTLAGPMVRRERRQNGTAQPGTGDSDALPPDWEIRYPRGGGSEAYFYNITTQKSTWTHPGLVSGGSSPSKDRENGTSQVADTRSPAPGGLDLAMRASSLERGRSGRKDANQKVSPSDQMSYEDRHYRPGEPATVAEPGVRRATYDSVVFPDPPIPTRTQSPRPVGGRFRSRSITPPRRDLPAHDRVERSRRDFTPPRTPVDHGTWREPQRDILPAGRAGGMPERAWGPPRKSVSLEPVQPQRLNNRSRDRPPRLDMDSPQFSPAYQDQSIRNGPDEWSAPRHRSPPPLVRDASPPALRRPAQGLGMGLLVPPAPFPDPPKQRSRFDQPVNPVQSAAARGPSRLPNDFGPPGQIPQRRGRDYEGPEIGPDFDPKRRRVEDRVADPPLEQRAPADILSAHGLPQRPNTSPFPSPAPGDQSRSRKRPPLPPQSTRFAEASRGPTTETIPPTSPTISSQEGSPFPSSRPLNEGGAPLRFTNSFPSDVPSAPRRQLPPPNRDADLDMVPRGAPTRPTAPSGRPSRFDKPSAAPPRDLLPTDRNAMDIDPSPHISAIRMHDGPARANMGMYADRMATDPPVDAPPRGPRAMTKGGVPGMYQPPPPSPPSLSPVAPFSNLRPAPLPDPASMPGRSRARPFQPQPVDNDPWAERRDRQEVPLNHANGHLMSSDFHPGRMDDDRSVLHNGPPGRSTRVESRQQFPQDMRDQRDLPPRFPRHPDGPAMPRSFSNPNLAAANKRDVYEPPVEPVPPRSTDRWRPTGVGESTRSRALPGNPDDEFGRTASSYHPVSPTNHYRPSMPNVDTNDRRPSFSGNRNDVPTFDRPPPPIDAYQNGGSSARPRRDSAYKQDDRPRGSRFDPEPAQQSPSSPVDSEPRIWMTREQSRAVFQVDHPQRPPPSSRTSNSRPPRADPTSWQPPFDESNLPSRRFNDGAPPPGRHDIPPRPPVDESPRMRRQDFSSDRGSERSSPIETRPRPLEGRLGSHYDEQYRYPPMEGPSQPSLPLRPRDRDIYPEPPPSADLKDVRDRPPPFRDEPPPTWDRSGAGRDDFKEPLPKAAVKTHPDRARLIGPAPDLPPTEDVLTNMRTSKPVRIRRPPPMPKTQQQQQQDNLATQMSMGSQELPPKPQGMREDERVSPAGAADLPFGHGAARPPNARHGGSLLDRLSLDDSHTEAPSPSLRDRVEGKGDAQLDAMDMESEGNGDGNGDPSMRGGKGGKRRFVKTKRGRRGAGF